MVRGRPEFVHEALKLVFSRNSMLLARNEASQTLLVTVASRPDSDRRESKHALTDCRDLSRKSTRHGKNSIIIHSAPIRIGAHCSFVADLEL